MKKPTYFTSVLENNALAAGVLGEEISHVVHAAVDHDPTGALMVVVSNLFNIHFANIPVSYAIKQKKEKCLFKKVRVRP